MADLVYSTNGGKKKQDKKSKKSYVKGEGPIKARIERKGRGGKEVTVLFNLPFDEKEAKKLMKELQGVLACGATLKESQIEFRGDMREKIKTYMDKKGQKVVLAGG